MSQPPDKPSSGNDKDYYKVLSDVMEDQKERETRRQSASAVQRANRSNSNTLATIAMVCGALSVYVWTNPPDFIQPAQFEDQPELRTDAALRNQIQVAANAVNRYLAENQELPESLGEAGVPSGTLAVVTYTRLGAELFEVRAAEYVEASEDQPADTFELIYTSDMNLEAFVGNAGTILLQADSGGAG